MDYILHPENKLRVEFDLKRNFSLRETSVALDALDKLFRRRAIKYIKSIDPDRKPKQEELGLYLTQLKTGSLTAELFQAAPFLIGMLPHVHDLSLYTDYVDSLKYLIQKFEDIALNKSQPTVEIARTDAECVAKLAKIFTNQSVQGELRAGAFRREVNFGDYRAVTEFAVGADKMSLAHNGAEIVKAFLENHRHREFVDEVMTIHQINESFSGEKGDEVVIKNVSTRPLRVTFASVGGEYLKTHLVNDPSNPLKQEFIVSGMVSLDLDDRPVAYHLTSVKKCDDNS